jgi:hypothetical protein
VRIAHEPIEDDPLREHDQSDGDTKRYDAPGWPDVPERPAKIHEGGGDRGDLHDVEGRVDARREDPLERCQHGKDDDGRGIGASRPPLAQAGLARFCREFHHEDARRLSQPVLEAPD